MAYRQEKKEYFYPLGRGPIEMQPTVIKGRRAPTTADRGVYGQVWIYGNVVYMQTSKTSTTSTWTQIS